MLDSEVKDQSKVLARKRYSQEYKKKVLDRLKNERLSDVSRSENLIPGTIRIWKKKYEEEGLEGLVKKSRRPNHSPKKTGQWIIDIIKGKKKEKPEMGSQAMSEHLSRFDDVDLSSSTVGKIFKKENLPDGDAGYAKSSHYVKGDKGKKLEKSLEAELGEWERFCRPHPNDLWQMDIMSFYIRDAHKVYLISALDDCSRLIVGWGLFKQQTADNVLEVLRSSLARHGAPKEILTDQGAQFKHWGGVTQFEKLLKKLRIQHIKARAHHPQTCGKIEAFHKTIHRELIDKEFFISQEQAIEKIARFIEHYNYARTHSSLDGYTPSDRYFGVIDAVKKYLQDFRAPKNELEQADPSIGIARDSKLYLVGKILGQEIRLQELGGQVSIHVNNQLFRDINFLSPVEK
jgi:transposase InsO family protein